MSEINFGLAAMWLMFTMGWMYYADKFKQDYRETFKSATMEVVYMIVKFGVPAILMNVIGLARQINVALGVLS